MTPLHADRCEDEGDEGEDAAQHRGRSRTRIVRPTTSSSVRMLTGASGSIACTTLVTLDASASGSWLVWTKSVMAPPGRCVFGNEDRLLDGAVEGGSHVADDADDRPFNIDRLAAPGTDRTADIGALDDALAALAAIDTRRAHVVELRFFGGLSVEKTAQALAIWPQTVMRGWKVARAWLAREVGQ